MQYPSTALSEHKTVDHIHTLRVFTVLCAIQLREEWRCLNEAKLLSQVQATNFVSVNDAARLELAAKVQQALHQVRALPALLPSRPLSLPSVLA